MIQADRRQPIFTSDDRIEYIENPWVIQLHNSLKAMTGKLLIRGLTSGNFQRINDKYIMDIWDKKHVSISTLKKLNMCRLYLRVARLSDIVTNNGKHIQDAYFNGTKINQYVSHDWPLQEQPSKPMWTL